MAISAAAAPNSWPSPAKNVWLVDAQPRDIVYRETRAVVAGKLNWCYLSVSAFFVFATIFPLTLLLPQVPFPVCFFNGSSTLFISFVVFLPCTFILVRRGCEESAFNVAQQNPHAFSGKNTIRDVEAVIRSRYVNLFPCFHRPYS